MSRKIKAEPARRGVERNPETGELAQPGHSWVRSAMDGRYCQEADGTPFACSVSSETYWCS